MKRIGLDISVLNDTQRTGIGIYAYEIIKALIALDKKYKFILFGFSTLESYKYLSSLELINSPNVQVKIIKIPARLFRSVFFLWQKLDWPPIEYFIGETDIFHSFNWYLPPQKKGKRVATVFDLTSQHHPEWHLPQTTQLDKIRFERIAKNADLVTVISNNTKKDFSEFNPRGRVEIIYPSTSLNLQDKLTDMEVRSFYKKHKIKSGFILSVSTLEPRKNLNTLIQAFIGAKIPNQLILAGKLGWKSSDLEKLIKKYPDAIVPLGFVTNKELSMLYKNATCLVYPSFYEGFGIPVLEAMSQGTPVICSNSSSLPEVGGDAVIYFDPYNFNELKDILVNISKNKKILTPLSQKGLRQSKKFSWEKSARKLINLYHSL